MKLGVVVITNKEKLTEKFLRQVGFADWLYVVYETKKPILEAKFSKVSFERAGAVNFSEKRNLGLRVSKTDWVLFVDDDEVVSKELAEEIRREVSGTKLSGFFVKRVDVCFYDVMCWGELKNQHLLRLAKRDSGTFDRAVHEKWIVKGSLGNLKNLLYHQKDNFVSEFIGRITTYGKLDADSLIKEGKGYSVFKLLFYPKLKFFWNYICKQGFRDGYAGLFLAYFMSVQSMSVRVFQWEKQRS